MTTPPTDVVTRLLVLAGLVWVLAGCMGPSSAARPSPRGTTASASSRVDEINLVALPVPVNLESMPGVDGIVLKIYGASYKHPRTQPIHSGVLEVLMWDGLVRGSADETNRCRHIWTFTAQELPGYAFTTTVGTGYFFQLGWGKDKPQGDKITLVARYQPAQGQAVYSVPSYIAIPAPLPVTPAGKPGP
ncbi:MAG: hypothetical protein NT154_36645 [Verrucomicrobia bacterium]|nr:hypothetical protein [Verrucomicrobiota bacterium]